MDPDANLKEQLELADTILNTEHDRTEIPAEQACRLAELVVALDEWMTSRGFPPRRWSMEHQAVTTGE